MDFDQIGKQLISAANKGQYDVVNALLAELSLEEFSNISSEDIYVALFMLVHQRNIEREPAAIDAVGTFFEKATATSLSANRYQQMIEHLSRTDKPLALEAALRHTDPSLISNLLTSNVDQTMSNLFITKGYHDNNELSAARAFMETLGHLVSQGNINLALRLSPTGVDHEAANVIINNINAEKLDAFPAQYREYLETQKKVAILTSEDNVMNVAGYKVVYGAHGDDILNGTNIAYSLKLYGNQGDDTLSGGLQNDRLSGGAGNDTLRGQKGDDVLTGGAGADILVGGAGADVFYFSRTEDSMDRIVDFSAKEGDRIHITDLLIGYDPLQDNLADFVSVSRTSNGTNLMVDADGAGTAHAAKAVAFLAGANVTVESLAPSLIVNDSWHIS